MIVPVSIASGRVGMFVLSGLCWLTVSGLSAETPESAFRSTLVRITAMPDAVDVPVEWKYTNRWDFPLVVEKFEQSCGCLAGGLAGESVDPGESGVIRAKFTPGANRGTVRKSIHVRFGGHEKTVELVAEASIPSGVELSGRELAWFAGGKPETRTIDATSGTGADFSITGLEGIPAERFSITRETLVEKRHYRLHITPADDSAPGVQCLQILTDSADPRERVMPVFLRISPAATVGDTPPSAASDALPIIP